MKEALNELENSQQQKNHNSNCVYFFFFIRVKVHYLIRLFYTFPSAFSLVNSSSPLGMDSGMVYSVKRDRRSKVVLSYRFFLQFKTKV